MAVSIMSLKSCRPNTKWKCYLSNFTLQIFLKILNKCSCRYWFFHTNFKPRLLKAKRSRILYLVIITYVCYPALFSQPFYLVNTIINEVLKIFPCLSCRICRSLWVYLILEDWKKHQMQSYLLLKKLYPANSRRCFRAMQSASHNFP